MSLLLAATAPTPPSVLGAMVLGAPPQFDALFSPSRIWASNRKQATAAPGAQYRFGTHNEAYYNSQIAAQVWHAVVTPPAPPSANIPFIAVQPQYFDFTLPASIQPALIKGSASSAVKFAIGAPQAVDLTLQARLMSAAATPPVATGAIVPFASASPQYVDPPQPSVWTPSFWVITLAGAQLSFATGQVSVPSGSGPAGRHRKWYAVKDGYKLLVFESKEAADAARAALKVPEARRRTIKVKAPKPVEIIDLKVLRREAALNDRLSDYIAYEQNRQYRELIQMRHHLAKDEEDIARALLKLMSYDEITEEEIAIVLAKL